MMTTVIESADLREAPAPHVLGQIHRDLTAEAAGLPVSTDSPRSKVRRYHLFDLEEWNRPDWRPLVRSGHLRPPAPILHGRDQQLARISHRLLAKGRPSWHN